MMAFNVINIVVSRRPALVAFGAIAGATLKPRKALLAAIGIWLVWSVNQYYSYSHSSFGHNPPNSWFFGVGLEGVEILMITALGAIRPTFSRINSKGHYVWMIIAVVVGLLFEIFVSLAVGFFVMSSWFGSALVWYSIWRDFLYSLTILSKTFAKTFISYLMFVPTLTLIHFFFTRFTVRSIE